MQDLIRRVEEAGASLVVREGRLFATPPGRLTAELLGLLAERKGELVAHLSAAGDPRWEEYAEAAAERAWADPPRFGEAPPPGDQSVIVRHEGWPTVALPLAGVEAWLAWNRKAGG